MLNGCRKGRHVGVVDLSLYGHDVGGYANKVVALERGVVVIASALCT
jgi:hypothetical protein